MPTCQCMHVSSSPCTEKTRVAHSFTERAQRRSVCLIFDLTLRVHHLVHEVVDGGMVLLRYLPVLWFSGREVQVLDDMEETNQDPRIREVRPEHANIV